jgi:hypothetical protein
MRDPVNHNPLRWSTATLVGVGSILVAGLIHLILTPEHFEEATYLGLLFLANFAGSAVAAFGIFRGQRWGWVLGVVVAGGAYVLYIASGTLGLPGMEPQSLLEPLGVVAKVVEALFLVLCAFVFTGALPAARRWILVLGIAALLLMVLPGLALALMPSDLHEDHDSDQHEKGLLIPRSAGPLG